MTAACVGVGCILFMEFILFTVYFIYRRVRPACVTAEVPVARQPKVERGGRHGRCGFMIGHMGVVMVLYSG